MWGMTKVKNGHGKYFDEWGERDLRDMIRRDRNHPSVVMWSIGNEILEQAKPDGWKVAKRLTDICHEEDPTRPVDRRASTRSENAIKNRPGRPGGHPRLQLRRPRVREDPGRAPGVDDRRRGDGLLRQLARRLPPADREVREAPLAAGHELRRDRAAAGRTARTSSSPGSRQLAAGARRVRVDGLRLPRRADARTSPWDKPRDEKDWPARSSYFGIVDLAGFPKDRFYLYQSQWTKAPMVHVLPHWNWAGREGQPIPVMAYTNAEEVELFLNGRVARAEEEGREPYVIPVGQKISDDLRFTTKYRVVWEVPYAPGTLKAVAYAGGQPVASDRGEDGRRAGAGRARAGPDDDPRRRRGPVVRHGAHRGRGRQPRARAPTTSCASRWRAPGRIAAVDNGNAASLEPFQADSARRSPASRSSSCARSGRVGPIRRHRDVGRPEARAPDGS